MTAIATPPAAPSTSADAPARPVGSHRAAVSVPARAVRAARLVFRKLMAVLSTLVLLGAVVALLGMTVGPRVFGYRTATMLTGSMVPTIRPGDVVVDVRETATDLRVGQILTYQIPVDDHRVESHRITWIGHDKSGDILFRTKGDANNGEDPWTARLAPHATAWRVSGVVPLAGAVIRFLRQPLVQLVLTRVLPFLILASVLLTIWRRPSAPEQQVDTGAPSS